MTGDECKCPKCLDTESQAIRADRDKPLGYAPPDIPEPADRTTQALRKQYRVGWDDGYRKGQDYIIAALRLHGFDTVADKMKRVRVD